MQQLKGSMKKAWGKLTDDDVALYEGQKDKFYGRVTELHGDAREAAEKKMAEMEKACGCASNENKAA